MDTRKGTWSGAPKGKQLGRTIWPNEKHVARDLGRNGQRLSKLTPNADGIRQGVAPAGASFAHTFQLMPLSDLGKRWIFLAGAADGSEVTWFLFACRAGGEHAGGMSDLSLNHAHRHPCRYVCHVSRLPWFGRCRSWRLSGAAAALIDNLLGGHAIDGVSASQFGRIERAIGRLQKQIAHIGG